MIWTFQSALDKVWQHFIVEGHAPGYDKGCVYWIKEKQCGCAIGILLTKEARESLMAERSMTVRDVFRANVDIASQFDDPYNEFWLDIQQAHDESICSSIQNDFKYKLGLSLKELAEQYDLRLQAVG